MSIKLTAFKCKDKIDFLNKFKNEAFEKLKEIYSIEAIKNAVHITYKDLILKFGTKILLKINKKILYKHIFE